MHNPISKLIRIAKHDPSDLRANIAATLLLTLVVVATVGVFWGLIFALEHFPTWVFITIGLLLWAAGFTYVTKTEDS